MKKNQQYCKRNNVYTFFRSQFQRNEYIYQYVGRCTWIMQKVFFRNLVAFFIASATLLKNKQPFKPHKGCFKYHILRSSLGLSGMIGNFQPLLKWHQTSDAAMLNKMSPFFTLIFSYIFLKEKFKPKQALAIAIAFAGSLL